MTPLSARAHVFVDDLDHPNLTDDDHHHLARVLRLSPGADITVSDGRGRWRAGRVGAGPKVEPAGDVVSEPCPAPLLTVGFAVVKGARPELTVQKLTELGIDRLVPFLAERGVVRWDPVKVDRQDRRLTDIAREAAMQSRRTWLPQVDRLTSFADVAALPGAALADIRGVAPSLRHPTVLVGPEGGWAMSEHDAGLPWLRVGVNVLRAETAAITVGALLAALRAGLVLEHASSAYDV